ncbi:MAG: glycosyltransferase family 2 protein [Alphaproteobacteria bacterium]|nr:glycosyltransferase family 2 protein [Alphaproteobacteria bacterium]
MAPPSLTALVVTHRGGALLERCLAALRPQLGASDELLVAVSARPGEAALEPCARWGAQALQLRDNVGYARAANHGLACSRGRAVLLLNDDTRALPGFVGALRAAAGAPGLYQPRILLSDGSGRLDNAGHGLFPDGFNWARGREDDDGAPYDAPGSVGAISGAAMLLTREVLDAVGTFDEDLGAFGEDVDLSLRARRRGFPLCYVPQARIEHDLGATYGRYGAAKVYLVERNRVRAAVRSLPMSAVLTMPAWTGLRLAGLGVAAGANRGWSGRVEPGCRRAALRGIAAGLAHLPDALEKRRRDAPGWQLGEADMWAHLLQHRVRLRDVLR